MENGKRLILVEATILYYNKQQTQFYALFRSTVESYIGSYNLRETLIKKQEVQEVQEVKTWVG